MNELAFATDEVAAIDMDDVVASAARDGVAKAVASVHEVREPGAEDVPSGGVIGADAVVRQTALPSAVAADKA